MHFDGWDTMQGRHLVYAYAAVLLLQAGYAGYVALGWLRANREDKKATKSP